MTVNQIKNTLPIKKDTRDVECVYMELYDCYITIESFIGLFGEHELSYNSLKNADTTRTWKKQFKSWEEQGILN